MRRGLSHYRNEKTNLCNNIDQVRVKSDFATLNSAPLSVNIVFVVTINVHTVEPIFEPRCEKTGLLHMRKQRR